MAGIHVTDIESAINWWRQRSPSLDGITACPEVLALAEVYALMVYHHENTCDEHVMPLRAQRRGGAFAVFLRAGENDAHQANRPGGASRRM